MPSCTNDTPTDRISKRKLPNCALLTCEHEMMLAQEVWQMARRMHRALGGPSRREMRKRARDAGYGGFGWVPK